MSAHLNKETRDANTVRPDPEHGATLDLPLLSHVLNAKLPDSSEAPQVSKTVSRPRPNAPSPVRRLLDRV